MIEAYERITNVPIFTEAFSEGSFTLDPGITQVVLTGLATAHARRLDILLTQTAVGAGNGIQQVRVRTFSGGRKFSWEYQVNAAFTTASHGVQVGETYSAATADYVIGDTCDIVLVNGAAANTVQVWVIART